MTDPAPTANPDHDPAGSLVRDRLANERTFLAWVRTAANVMIVGLAIARFGDGGEVTGASLSAGAVLVATGGAGVVYAARRYRAADRALIAGSLHAGGGTTGPVVAAAVLAGAVAIAVIVLIAAS